MLVAPASAGAATSAASLISAGASSWAWVNWSAVGCDSWLAISCASAQYGSAGSPLPLDSALMSEPAAVVGGAVVVAGASVVAGAAVVAAAAVVALVASSSSPQAANVR